MRVSSGRRAFYDQASEEDKARTARRAMSPTVPPSEKGRRALVAKAKELHARLQEKFAVAWDDRGNIGKRYLAQDEIGTPFCITVDFDTLGGEGDGSLKDTVTVRDRDSMAQERVKISELEAYLEEKLRA